jgi:hypothetical protein
VGRGHQRVATSGYVGPDRADRDAALAEEDTRLGFDLEVGQGVPLVAGEVANIALHSADVVENAGVDLVDDPLDLVR